MRKTILVMALALAACQSEEPAAKSKPLPPMGSGPLQDREFTRPLLGILRYNGSEGVLRFDPAQNVIYFGVKVKGSVYQSTVPFTKPDLMNTAGRIDTPDYLIQLSRLDCKNDDKQLGPGTITASVNSKANPGEAYQFCLVADWPKDVKLPGWATKAFAAK